MRKRSVSLKKWAPSCVVAGALAVSSTTVFASDNYKLQGPCAYLPADRATEFHGNAEEAYLKLGMAGNQWVVFDKVMQGYNLATGRGDGTEPQHHDNKEGGSDYWTLDKLNAKDRQYYIELIPPGLVRKQIKSGCLILGNDEERNFLPGSIQVDFDIFASTNYGLMQDLANSGFVSEAVPYIKNKLDLMVDLDNTKGIGSAGQPGTYENIYDIVLDLLDSTIKVSEVDHVNEGVHRAINKMYKSMDEYIREHGSAADIAALDAALDAVKTAQPGSPSDTRPGTPALYVMADNPDCHYSGHPTITDGTLRFCEFSILNKANTHETRVHHVETPERILNGTADVGPVWVSELGYQLVRDVPVSGMDQVGGAGGVNSPADADPVVNAPATYSIAVLATSEESDRAQGFIDFVRSPEGQKAYTDGGFIGLTAEEMEGGFCYDEDGIATPRMGECDD